MRRTQPRTTATHRSHAPQPRTAATHRSHAPQPRTAATHRSHAPQPRTAATHYSVQQIVQFSTAHELDYEYEVMSSKFCKSSWQYNNALPKKYISLYYVRCIVTSSIDHPNFVHCTVRYVFSTVTTVYSTVFSTVYSTVYRPV